jgi:hypothetical protein
MIRLQSLGDSYKTPTIKYVGSTCRKINPIINLKKKLYKSYIKID